MFESGSASSVATSITGTSRPVWSPVMYQRWESLLFLHWSVRPGIVQETLPPGLRVDTFNGKAWLGVVPFNMRKVRPRFLPSVPGISDFLELNLRTYVVDTQGRHGVWFYSLDTSHRLPVWIARRFFHLNYQWSRMSARMNGGQQYYTAKRMPDIDAKEQVYAWDSVGKASPATTNSLEFFLTERYRLFSYDNRRQQLWTGSVAHEPYILKSVSLNQWSTELFRLNGLKEPNEPPESILSASGVDVAIGPLRRAESAY